MDFIVELALEILFEAPLEAIMGSKKVKNSIKTALFSILGGLIVFFLGFAAYSTAKDGGIWRGIILAALTAGMLVIVIRGAILGHQKEWKQK